MPCPVPLFNWLVDRKSLCSIPVRVGIYHFAAWLPHPLSLPLVFCHVVSTNKRAGIILFKKGFLFIYIDIVQDNTILRFSLATFDATLVHYFPPFLGMTIKERAMPTIKDNRLVANHFHFIPRQTRRANNCVFIRISPRVAFVNQKCRFFSRVLFLSN